MVFIGNNGSDNPGVIYKYMGLTPGKVYDYIWTPDDGYVCVINDFGYEELYVYYMFVSLSEWRDRKIGEVLGGKL